jgi:hypothetical protein
MEPININTKFSLLFAIYNIACAFKENTLSMHLNTIISERFINNYKLSLLLKEYKRLYESIIL